MERGFLRDRTHGGNLPVQWIAGAPEMSAFLGSLKLRGKVRYQITVFRCKQCGYLEHYATERLLKDIGFFRND
jgi:hypothetical protein